MTTKMPAKSKSKHKAKSPVWLSTKVTTVPPPLVDIAITTKNNVVGLAQLLAVLHTTDYPNFRIVLNDESDVSVLLTPQVIRAFDLLAMRGVQFRFNRNAVSKGTPYAEHLVFSMCDAPYIWVIDDDCIPNANALSLLVATAEEFLDAGFIQGCFGDITNSRGHQNFDIREQAVPQSEFPPYYYLYNDDVVRSLPYGEGGNLLFRTSALKAVTNNYWNADFIADYGNNSGIHIVISALVGNGVLRTGSRVFHLERHNPRFSFKSVRNTIMLRYLSSILDANAMAPIKEYMGVNNF